MMHYDVAVIGGGIAGYSAALRALQAGKKVVLIN
ncbi:FAD-dependent oxidoreductase, partial [Vibrio parahaemolyticus]|nr:FAD-dependent oxidoreductase [Vibrio parahaemolyticus]